MYSYFGRGCRGSSVDDVLQWLRPQRGEVDLLVQLLIQFTNHGTARTRSEHGRVRERFWGGVHVVSADDVETEENLFHALSRVHPLMGALYNDVRELIKAAQRALREFVVINDKHCAIS
jgi:hypothetical protein